VKNKMWSNILWEDPNKIKAKLNKGYYDWVNARKQKEEKENGN